MSIYVNVENLKKNIGDYYDKLSQMSYTILRNNSVRGFAENLTPVKIMVSIRTDLTNEILVDDLSVKFYSDCTPVTSEEHGLDDLIILACKNKVLESLSIPEQDLHKFIVRTSLYPVGACVQDDEPIVYANVIIDHLLQKEPFFALNRCKFVPIESINPQTFFEEEMKKSLIIVSR